MLLLNLLVLTLGFIHCCQARRILGGNTIDIVKVPFLVQVERDGQLRCGGSLIESNVVLTAAHCVEPYLHKKITVRGRSTTRKFGGEQIEVSQIILPRRYVVETQDWDVAILILESHMEGVKTIELCNGPVPTGAAVQVSGWGTINPEVQDSTQHLRTVLVNIRDHSQCVNNYQPDIVVTENMICANAKGKDSCTGDSGGPLVYAGKLCGIVSGGSSCGVFDYPGLYSDVNKFLTFIKDARNATLLENDTNRFFVKDMK